MDSEMKVKEEQQASCFGQGIEVKNEFDSNQESGSSSNQGQTSEATLGKFQCHKCAETFNDIISIKCHWHDVHGLKHPAQCKICDIPFPDSQLAHKHKKEAHGSSCPDCGKGFKKAKALEDHMKAVHGTRMEYPCHVCGLIANKKEMLIRHMQSHESQGTEKLVFRCDVCRKPFIDENELRDHEKIHDNPMNCEFCNELFPRKSALQAHKRDAHPEEHGDLKRKAAEQRMMNGGRDFRNNKRRRR